MIRKTSILAALFFMTVLTAFAQDTSRRVEMADTLRDNGKIYVVVAVLLTIFAGIIFYLVRLDRKITKLEKGD
jgi:hypothetical protein